MSLNINPFKTLPSNLVIKNAGNDFYRIGLSLFKFGSEKRIKLHNPLFVFTINTLYSIKCGLSLAFLKDDDNDGLFLLIGDLGHFMKVRYHMNICIILYALIGMSSQIINYWYYKNNVKPSYLKLFEMMSGLVSPQSIGLTNKKHIYKIVMRMKFLLFGARIILISTVRISIAVSMILLFQNESIIDICFITIPLGIVSVYTLIRTLV